VVAQLAARHALGVHLAASPAGGITAMVALPAVLLGEQAPPAVDDVLDGPVEELALGAAAVPPPLETRGDRGATQRPAAALPRRDSSAPFDDAPPLVHREPDFDPVDFAAAVLNPAADPGTPSAEPLAATRDEDSFEESPAAAVSFGELLGESTRTRSFTEESPEESFDESVLAGDSFDESSPRFGEEQVPGAVAAAAAAAVVEPQMDAAPPVTPPAPERPRLGIGTFADLRQVSTPTRPAPSPAPAHTHSAPATAAAPPASDAVPAPDDAGARHTSHDAPVASAAAAALHDVAPAPPERADERDDAAAALATANAAIFSEDLLPQKLPKRGRRSGRLATPWSREKPAKPVAPPKRAPAQPAVEHGANGAAPNGAQPPVGQPPNPLAPAATPAHAHLVEPRSKSERPADGALRFPPGGPALAGREHGDSERDPALAPAATPAPGQASEGEERFAFFAAFRAAAERAREEAGIDDRRIGQ
jgi:hypothetical protein